MDFFHAVVPVAYCDYALLDTHWAAQVARARSRFKRTSVNVPLATVFSRGRSECLPEQACRVPIEYS